MQKILAFVLFALVSLPELSAQTARVGGDDFMRQTGKIYVVVAVITLVLIGLLVLLLLMDVRLTKLENQILKSKHGRKSVHQKRQ